jgi:hypothetical protein
MVTGTESGKNQPGWDLYLPVSCCFVLSGPLCAYYNEYRFTTPELKGPVAGRVFPYFIGTICQLDLPVCW